MLTKIGGYNHIPEDKMPELPDAGTIVTYQFAKKLHDAASGHDFYPAHQQLPSFAKAKIGKNFIDIGLVGGVDHTGIPVSESIRRVQAYPARNGGYFHLTIGNAEDNDLYQFFELADWVATTDKPEITDKTILIKKDFKAEAKKQLDVARAKREAVTHALNLKGDALSRVGFLLGMGKVEDPETLQLQIWQAAERNPEEYFLKVDDKDAEPKSTLAQALAVGSVKLDSENKCLKWSNDALLLDLLQADSESAVLAEFAEYIKGDKNGSKIVEAMKKATEVEGRKKKD